MNVDDAQSDSLLAVCCALPQSFYLSVLKQSWHILLSPIVYNVFSLLCPAISHYHVISKHDRNHGQNYSNALPTDSPVWLHRPRAAEFSRQLKISQNQLSTRWNVLRLAENRFAENSSSLYSPLILFRLQFCSFRRRI